MNLWYKQTVDEILKYGFPHGLESQESCGAVYSTHKKPLDILSYKFISAYIHEI